MAETVWVLQRAYGLAPADIAAAVERVLLSEREQEVFTTMIALKVSRLPDFRLPQ